MIATCKTPKSLYHPKQAGGVSDMRLTGYYPHLSKRAQASGQFSNSVLDAAGIKSISADVKRLIRVHLKGQSDMNASCTPYFGTRC